MTRVSKRVVASLVGGAAFALVSMTSSQALAVSKCGDQTHQASCGASNPFPCCSNGGNCTWWAWEAACRNWHVDVPMRHNAKTWADAAKADPNYKVLDHPVVGSIAVSTYGQWGHVAWVTGVHGNQIDVTDEKCGDGYGMHHNTYYASQFAGGFIVRADYQEGGSTGSSGGGCAAHPSPDQKTPWSASFFVGISGLWFERRRRQKKQRYF